MYKGGTMKNRKLVILAVILIVILLVFVTLISLKNTKPKEVITIRDELEFKYSKEGSYDVGYIEHESSNLKTGKYSIWYPMKMEDKRYPVIVIANGTGATAETHKDVFKHLASWGFIVIGNEDKNSWTGESTFLSLEHILQINNNKDSILYNKIDTNKIGVSGHSQGGVGAINAVCNYENSNYFKSIYTASCASIEVSSMLGWEYDTNQINIPYFMSAGTGDIDAGLIAPLDSLENAYNDIKSRKLTVMGRKKGVDHREVLKEGKGYMVAWFLATLNEDNEAKKVFYGRNSEIQINTEHWQDVQIKNN
jgi:hypothetical protein